MSGFRIVVGVLLTTFLSTAAFAQSARAVGTVKDTNGRPIKGAIVRAVNRDASPSQITSTTDDKGRWAMIGLKTGTWQFTAEAPGFTPVQASAPVRVAATPPMGFALARDPGPIPGALDKNVIQSVNAANALRDRGQYDQALSAYQQIREQNPKLTSVSFVVAGTYRKQAAAEWKKLLTEVDAYAKKYGVKVQTHRRDPQTGQVTPRKAEEEIKEPPLTEEELADLRKRCPKARVPGMSCMVSGGRIEDGKIKHCEYKCIPAVKRR